MTLNNMPFSPSTIDAKKPLKRGPTEAERLSVAKKKAAEETIVLEEERVYRTGTVSVRDIISPAAFKVDPSFVQIGSSFARTIFVVTYPRYISVGWSSPIINLNTAFDIGMFFYPVKSEIILKQLKKKVGVLEAQIMSDSEKGAPRDPVRETALRDIEKLRDDLTQGIEHFFQYAFYVTLFANSKEALDKTTEEVESIFGSKLIYTKKVFFQSEQGFNSTLPLGNDELMITFNMNSSPIASSFPFISSDLTSDNGILYGINRHNNSLILFDRFSLQNANMVVFATSGAGKSVDYSTEVLIKDQTGAVRLLPIGKLIDDLGGQNTFEPIDQEMEGVVDPGLSVYTFNNNLQGEWSRVSVAARKTTPADMYVFRTASGREITVTGDHNMLVLRNGQVVAAKSQEVLAGEYVPLPRQVPEPVNPICSLDLFALLGDSSHLYISGLAEYIGRHYQLLTDKIIDKKYDCYLPQYRAGRRVPMIYAHKILKKIGAPLTLIESQSLRIGSKNKYNALGTHLGVNQEVTPEFMRLLGYIVSEGTIGAGFVLISNLDTTVRADIANCLKTLDLTYFNRASDGTFVVASRVFVELIHAVGAHGKAGAKRVPPFIFNCSNSLAAEFLRAYYEGDGGVEQHAVTACTKSKGLASDLAYLLLRFGVVVRLCEKEKSVSGSAIRGIYHIISISGQEYIQIFRRYINFVTQRKRHLLDEISDKRDNTNVDIVPVQEILQDLYESFTPPLRGLQKLIELKNGSYQPSRDELRLAIEMIEERVDQFVEAENVYAHLLQLPVLEAVVAQGNDGGTYNQQLRSTLGDSWRLMKNGAVAPRANNVFRAVATMGGPVFSLSYFKETIHKGFKELGLELKTSRSLEASLNGRFESDVNYSLLYDAAGKVWNQYESLRSRLPLVHQCIDRLKGLLHADLFWDPIVDIQKKTAKHPYVYDLTVDNEVFLAGHGGLFVHNSYTVKLEVLRSLMLGTDVMIIDPEMEYKHLSDAVGGSYINISLASDSKVNPFDLPRPVGEEVSVEDIIRSAVITVKGLVRIMLGKVTNEEDSLIDRALLETYAKKDIVPGVDLTKVEPPIMQDFADVLEGMEGTKDILIRIKKYTEGTFAGLLNSPTTVDVKNQLVVFSVRDLEDELRPMAIYTIVNHIWNVVRSESKKRILVIDEAWWLMQHEDSAKFVFALIKRCRKYYLGVTTITQDVNDFLTSPYGQAIVNNSALQLLMKQSPAAVEQIAKVFLLTQGEKYLLLEAGVGEGIFFAGQKHAAIKVVASYTEDQLITTDPRQLLEIEEAKREFDEKMKE